MKTATVEQAVLNKRLKNVPSEFSLLKKQRFYYILIHLIHNIFFSASNSDKFSYFSAPFKAEIQGLQILPKFFYLLLGVFLPSQRIQQTCQQVES